MTLLDDVQTTSERLRNNPSRRTAPETAGVNTAGARRARSRAAQRAIDRHAKRREINGADSRRRRLVTTVPTPGRIGLAGRARRVPFVVPVLVLLALGLGLSLWLSTKAAQDSYQIGVARNENQTLADKYDSLKQSVESGNSASELADKAAALGMVPAQNPARMIVGANGKSRLSGEPAAATGKPMGTINRDNTPDPTSQIDPKKVDDSVGLGGQSATARPTSTPTTPSAPTTPAGASTPASPTAPAAVPGGAQGSPNVLPSAASPTSPGVSTVPTTSHGNPPSRNSAESR